MRGSDYTELRAFAAVVRHGSFTRAAEGLGISPSALSQMIRSLEERLGQRLLNRTTRSVAPSHAGQALAERLLPVLDDLDGVMDATFAAAGEVAGPLRLNTARVAIPMLSALIPGFLTRYPRVSLEVVASDALVDIVSQGFDAGIRLTERLEADMIGVPFGGDLRMAAAAAPAYLAAHPTPVHPRDLDQHRCLVTLTPSTGTPYRWEFEKGDEALRIAVAGPLLTENTALRRDAARAGLAVGFFFEAEVAADFASGRLVRLLEDWTPPYPGCQLYYPSRRLPPPPLRAFIDHLRGAGRAEVKES
ncbi:LysR family transcriptional regulator [Tabrizicola sp.]|uniref:LysR family transcriptional regulator n=1 Tax=Tabrizicola sp. TaxID=2005166 RepID=UPI003F385315